MIHEHKQFWGMIHEHKKFWGIFVDGTRVGLAHRQGCQMGGYNWVGYIKLIYPFIAH